MAYRRERLAAWHTFPIRAVVLALVVGVAAGLAVVAGVGLYLIAGLVCLVFMVATWNRPDLAVAAMLVLLPPLGRVALVTLPGIPDVTAGRLSALWALVVVGRAALQARDSEPATLANPDRTVASGPLTAWIGVFLAFMLLASLRSPDVVAGLQGWLDEYLLPLVAFLVFSRLRWPEDRSETIITWYLGACCLWTLLALFEFVTKQSLFTPDGALSWASHGAPYGRTGGPFINPAFLGTAVGVGLVLAWVSLGRQGRLRRVALLSLPFCAVSLVVCLTRASWIGAAAGMLVALVLTRRDRLTTLVVTASSVLVGIVLLTSMLGSGFLGSRTTSTSEVFNRIAVQGAAVRMIADYPLLGVGSDRFEALAQEYLQDVGSVSAAFGVGVAVPHNSVLDATVDGGLGAGASLVVIFVLLLAAGRLLLARPARRYFGVAAISCLTVFVANAMFVDMSLGPTVSTLILTLVAVFLSTSTDEEAVIS